MRIAKVVGILLALGALSGAVVGVLVAFALLALRFHNVSGDGEIYLAAAIFGAICGAVSGPPIALTFLRRVPLWRATAQVAGAAGLGSVLGDFLFSRDGWIYGALTMAIAMALWLRRKYRNAAAAPVKVEV